MNVMGYYTKVLLFWVCFTVIGSLSLFLYIVYYEREHKKIRPVLDAFISAVAVIPIVVLAHIFFWYIISQTDPREEWISETVAGIFLFGILSIPVIFTVKLWKYLSNKKEEHTKSPITLENYWEDYFNSIHKQDKGRADEKKVEPTFRVMRTREIPKADTLYFAKLVRRLWFNIFPSRGNLLKKKILKEAMHTVNEEIILHDLSMAKYEKAFLKEKLRNVIIEHFSAYKAESILRNQAEFHELIKTMIHEFRK